MTRVTGLQTATKLTLAANTPTALGAANTAAPRLSITVKPVGAIFLGGANVTAANGYPLGAGETLTLDCSGGLYGLSVAGGDVNILEGS